MLLALKAGVSAATLWTIASAVGDLAMDVVAIGGAVGVVVAGVTWLWRKMLLPAARAFQRTYDAVEALEDLGGFMAEQRRSVEEAGEHAAMAAAASGALEVRLDLLERHVGLFASEDAQRVREAMAGGERRRRRTDAA